MKTQSIDSVKASELTEIQEALVQLLKESELSEQTIIVIMLMLKDDEEAQKDLLLWLYDTKPTAEEVMSNWVPGYLRAKNAEK